MSPTIVWFDMPVSDLDRAIRFYSAVLGRKVERRDMGDFAIGTFPHADGESGGCLAVMPERKPSYDGALLYFGCEGRLREAVAAVPANGGKVLADVHEIGPYGYRALIADSEGNRVALHSQKV